MTRVGAAGACTPGTSLRTARPTCTACTRGWRCWTGEAAPAPAPATLQLLARSGAAAGLLFLNSAAQELTLTPAPGLVYRTIGGLLDLYLFLGPEPEQVQYSTVQHSIVQYTVQYRAGGAAVHGGGGPVLHPAVLGTRLPSVQVR